MTLPKISAQKVYLLQSRQIDTFGAWGAWEDSTPGQRYSMDDLLQFQADLNLDDMWGTQWRGAAPLVYGLEPVRLTASGYHSVDHDRRFTKMDAGEVLPPTGWDGMLFQLTRGEFAPEGDAA